MDGWVDSVVTYGGGLGWGNGSGSGRVTYMVMCVIFDYQLGFRVLYGGCWWDRAWFIYVYVFFS